MKLDATSPHNGPAVLAPGHDRAIGQAATAALTRLNGGLPTNLHLMGRPALVRLVTQQQAELMRLRAGGA